MACPPDSPHALIIGSGIAGAAMALFLKRIGIAATVLEAHETATSIGGGLTVAPNGMRVLDHLGLADSIAAEGCEMRDICFRDHRGKVLAHYANARPGQYDQPAIALPRSKFHQILLQRVQDEEIQVVYAKRLIGIESEPDRVRAQFADGSRMAADFLIGADGIHSRTRRTILPDASPRYTGRLAVGGFVVSSGDPWPHDADSQQLNLTIGPSGSFGFCNGSRREARWMWWSTVAQECEPNQADGALLDAGRIRSQLGERHLDWHAPVEAFIDSTPRILATPIYEVPPLPFWSKGRVVLIGDAAHAMSPQAGQGASVGLEDAMYLAKVLRRYGGRLQDAFRAYEAERKQRAEQIAAQARKNAARQTSPVAFWFVRQMLSVLLPVVGPRSQPWMYDYAIDWEDTEMAA